MKKELDNKLCEDFPLLYRDRHLPMNESCMYWGFSCGDGWYELIYELSSKLEPLIQKQLDEMKEEPVCFCGCTREVHSEETGECLTVHKIPYHIYKYSYGFIVPKSKIKYAYRKSIAWIIRVINNGLEFISPVIHKNIDCKCKNGWEPYHSHASQVKEKFGTLRFYMDGATDEMYDLINEYDEKTAKTCELCGKPGKIKKERGWVRTLCKECRNERDIEIEKARDIEIEKALEELNERDS